MTEFDEPTPHDAEGGADKGAAGGEPEKLGTGGTPDAGRAAAHFPRDVFADDDEEAADVGSTDGQVRRESWRADGVAELELSVDMGRIEVDLSPAAEREVRVEVRYDPSAGGGWAQGISGVINWIGQATGGPHADAGDLAAEAVRAAEISWSEPGRRLVVRSSGDLPLRVVPLVITVVAPAGSRLAARTGAGDVRVGGRAGWAAVRTGSGDVDVAAVDGDIDVSSGSGDLRLGEVTGRARLRTGSGSVRLVSAGGPTDIKASNGDVTLGRVAADLGVRTGSGEVRVDDAHAGQLDLTTGSGEMRVGVHPGVRAELDLVTGSGRADSDLPVAASPPSGQVALHVRGRTGSGNVLVTRATVSA